MHEEKIALVDGQVKAVQQAVAARAVENVYFVACGGSLATLYPGKYILERETAAVSTGAYTAAEFLNDPPARLGEKSLVVLNSQSGGTPETAAAARLAAGDGLVAAVERGLEFIASSIRNHLRWEQPVRVDALKLW